MTTQGSKADVLGLDGRRVQSSVGAIQGNSGKLVEQKFENTNGNIDKPLIIQQQGRGFFSSGSKYEPLKEATVAVGVGVNDKAVTFSPYNFIDPPQLKTNQIDTQQLEAKVKKENESISKSNLRQPAYKILRDTTNTTLNIFTGFTGLNPIGNQDFIGGSRPPILQDPVQNSDYLQKNSVTIFRTRKELINPFQSYLLFSNSSKKIFLPFFENPIIEERRGASFSILNVIGSSNPILNYLHTDLAQIRVTFKLNSYHVAHMLKIAGYRNNDSFVIESNITDLAAGVSSFFIKDTNPSPSELTDDLGLTYSTLLGKPRQSFLTKFGRSLKETDILNNLDADLNNNTTNKPLGVYSEDFSTETNSYFQAQKLIAFWINTIKSFNVIDSNTPIADTDPITPWNTQAAISKRRFIYLKHGPAFHNIPTILDSYEIKEIQSTSFDVATNMANSFEITLNLKGAPEKWRNSSRLSESLNLNSENSSNQTSNNQSSNVGSSNPQVPIGSN